MKELHQEIDKIQDPEVRAWTAEVVTRAPIDAWRLASSRDHHVQDECTKWGNLRHTIRVVRICNTLADLLDLGPPDRDTLRSAAVLHDICKHGVNAGLQYICKEHPTLVKNLIEDLGLPHRPVIEYCIDQHMGRWGTVTCDWTGDNKITLAFLLHVADCIEARLPEMRLMKIE